MRKVDPFEYFTELNVRLLECRTTFSENQYPNKDGRLGDVGGRAGTEEDTLKGLKVLKLSFAPYQ